MKKPRRSRAIRDTRTGLTPIVAPKSDEPLLVSRFSRVAGMRELQPGSAIQTINDDEDTDAHAAVRLSMLDLDCRKYLPELEGLDLNGARKLELLETLRSTLILILELSLTTDVGQLMDHFTKLLEEGFDAE